MNRLAPLALLASVLLPEPAIAADFALARVDHTCCVGRATNFVGVTHSVTTGSTPVASLAGVGLYLVDLPGVAGASGNVGHVQVSAVGSSFPGTPGYYCKLALWGPSSSGSSAIVQCYDWHGKPAYTSFNLLYAGPDSDPDLAYTFADQPTAGSYTPSSVWTFNDLGPTHVQRVGVGRYIVDLGGHTKHGGTVMVTPYGWDHRRCHVDLWRRRAHSTRVEIGCSTPAGTPADAQFNLLYAKGTLPRPPSTPIRAAYAFAHDPTNPLYYPNPLFQWRSAPVALFTIARPYDEYVIEVETSMFATARSFVFTTPIGPGAEARGCNQTFGGVQPRVACWRDGGPHVPARFLAQAYVTF